jgi:3-hydroxyacyl-CoA dehydrogenase
MAIKKVVVAGGGVLGSQIAFQTAYCGFDVTIWLRSKGSITRTQPKIDAIKKDYLDTIAKMDTPEGKDPHIFARGIANVDTFNADDCRKKVEAAYKNIKLELDMKKALSDADLVIESMTENKDAKKEFYKAAAPLLPEKTILVTNSSTMLPSQFAKYTGRPDKYLALHFANEIWKNNTAEIMSQKKTDKASYDAVVKFAADIRMVPLQLHKEKSGYILNSMLVPFLFSALDLWVEGVSDPQTIDKTWVLGTGAPKGPFQIIDVVGLKTAYEIVSMYTKIPSFLAPYHFKDIAKALDEYIKAGKLGVSSGIGFYNYKK